MRRALLLCLALPTLASADYQITLLATSVEQTEDVRWHVETRSGNVLTLYGVNSVDVDGNGPPRMATGPAVGDLLVTFTVDDAVRAGDAWKIQLVSALHRARLRGSDVRSVRLVAGPSARSLCASRHPADAALEAACMRNMQQGADELERSTLPDRYRDTCRNRHPVDLALRAACERNQSDALSR